MPFTSARWLCLAAALAVAGRAEAQPLPPGLVTGAPTTQRLSFEAGPNQVSLSALPADRSIEAIFGAQLEHVLMVKDADGAVYSSQYGVRTLVEWPWDASVWVYAREPFSLDVSGPRIEPWSQIPLATGWSWVPSLVAAPTPVADALASLAAALSRVEDGAGRVYPAGPGEAALTTLDPGAGYRLRLAAPTTLAYAAVPPTLPPTPGGPPPAQTEVPTVLDAIALTGLAPGQEVAVRGFRADGDGGAGRLRVTTSGCTPDGGTCFVPTEHTAAGEPYSSDWGFTLYGEDLQWESFRLCHSQASTPQDASAVAGDGCFDAKQLHGHGAGAGGDKLFDPATGHVEITSSMKTFARLYDGTDRFTTTFRYSTDDVRLERIVDAPLTLEGRSTTDYTRPEWWGGRPNIGDATDAVAWALEAAEAHAAATGREHYVVLSGMYGYAGILETQTATALKGAIDGVRDGQGLRVVAGAPWHYWALKEETASAFREPATEHDAISQNTDGKVVVRHGRRSTGDRVVDVEIDGNLAENGYVFDAVHRAASGPSSYSGGSRVDELLQNTPHWNGFAASSEHLDVVPGSSTRLENIHIHDVGGNLWLSNEPVDFGGSHDVRLGNSARNHVIYGVGMRPESSIDRVEIYGFFWKGAHEIKQGTWRDVIFRDLVQPPILYTRDRLEVLVSHRNDDLDPREFGTPSASGNYFGEEILFERLTFDIDEAMPYTAVIYDRGPMDLRGVTVRQSAPGSLLRLVVSRGQNGARSAFRMSNVDVLSGGIHAVAIQNARTSDVRGLRTLAGSGYNGYSQFFSVRPGGPGAVFTFYDLAGPQAAARPLGLDTGVPNAGADVFIRNAAFTQVDYPAITEFGPSDAETLSRYRIFLKDVSFDIWRSSNLTGRTFFSGVTGQDGRRSETSGALTNAALSGGHIDVPAALIAPPQDTAFVTVAGPDAGRFTGWTNVGTDAAPVLRLAFSGTTPVSVQWSAAVQPIPAGVVFPD